MQKRIGVERLYYLGDYKNIKFASEVSEIPEELAMNETATELLFLQQYIGCELAYRKYVNMIETINETFTVEKGGKKIVDTEAVIQFLQEEKTQTLKQLYDEISGNKSAKDIKPQE